MSRVLVIAASMAQAEDMMRQHATHNYRDIEFRYPANISTKEASLQELYEDCCDVITDEDISAILSSKPSLQLVHSALLLDFPELRGPSFESAFLLLHRYYNKRVISVDFSPPFNIIDIDDIDPETLASVLEDFSSSALQLKDIFATENALSMRLRSKLPTPRDLTRIKKQLNENGDRIRRFVSDFLHKAKYPLALDPICLIDEDWDPRKRPVTIHYVEGCVTDGIIVPWAISDVQYCRHKPTYLTVVGLPTALDEEVQMGVWAVFRETVQRLMERGFQDQFVHAKVAVLDDGSVKVTDMAGCLLADNTALYRHVLNHGDNWRAQMDIGLGDTLSTPRTLPERYAMKVRVVTFANGHEVGDVIDLQKARALSEVDLFVKKEDAVIKMIDEDDGLHLANIYLFSTSYDRCMAQLTEITDEILKKPSSTPPGVTTTIVSTPASDDDEEDIVEGDDDVDGPVESTDFRGRARRGSFFTLPPRYDAEPSSTPDDTVGGNHLMVPFTAIPIEPTIPEEPESPGQEQAPAAGTVPVDEGPTTDGVAPTESDSAERSALQLGKAAANVKVRLTGPPIKQLTLTDTNATSARSRKLNIKLPPVPPRAPTFDSEARRFGSSMTLGLGQRLMVEIPAVMKPRTPGKQVYLAAPGGAPTRGRMVSPVVPGGLSTSHMTQKPKPTSMAISGQHGSLKVLSQSSKALKGSSTDTEPVSYRHAMALREAKETKQRLAETKKVTEQPPPPPPAKDTKVTFADKLPSGRESRVPARAAAPLTRRSTIALDSHPAGKLPEREEDVPRRSSGVSYMRQNNDHKRGGTVADKKMSSRQRQTANLKERTGSVT